MNPLVFITRDLLNDKTGIGDTDINEGLNFESVTPEFYVARWSFSFSVQTKRWKVLTPERVKPVAEI